MNIVALLPYSFINNLSHASGDVSIDHLGLDRLSEFLLNILPNQYITPRLGEILQFIVFKLLENVSANQIFTHGPHPKLSPRFL